MNPTQRIDYDDPDVDEPQDDFDDESDELEFDCHMDRNGDCGAAGSEECEFECPYNNRN